MANTDIYPYGQGATIPAGYPIANDLVTNSAQQSLSAAMGVKLAAMTRKNTLFVVANNASAAEKLAADYQCTGTNDELVIQQAVNAIYAGGGGTILLSSGTFYIDSFPNQDANDPDGGYCAILLPSNDTTGYEIRIIGDYHPYILDNGTKIEVSEACYESLDASTQYKIFHSTYSSLLANKAKISLMMMNMTVLMPWNQRKILCIDLRSVNRVYMQFLSCRGYKQGYNGYIPASTNPPAVAVQGCIGIRMTSGSNYGTCCDYKNVHCSGFYEGFQVGGEHVVGINLSGVWNVYSYTFGNYEWKEAFVHPITLINCCDERSVNLPYFANTNGQQITMIDFNFERTPAHTPGGVLGEAAMERVPGSFYGEISFTSQNGVNSTTAKFWKDGHGKRFQTKNAAHLLACDTTTRNGYVPNYLQHIWDTTLGKEVICVDTANKVWKDTNGNTV